SLISELARALRCSAVPIFPSLTKEGQEGGGDDVNFSLGAVPMFLQFKLSEHLKTNNAKEAKHPSGLISASSSRPARSRSCRPLKTAYARLIDTACPLPGCYTRGAPQAFDN
ncbi:MAG: hypothetical protein AAF231_02195, partial [Pseudomonadota bacterium]